MSTIRERFAEWLAPETRSTVAFVGPSLALGAAGPAVNAVAAENVAAVLAAVNAICTGLASLPATVYESTPTGRREAPGHPVSALVRLPNGNQSWPDWIEWTVAQALLYGNAISEIQADPTGRSVALVPIPWQNVSVQLLPTGRLAYDVVAVQGQFGGTGMPRRLLSHEVFHLRDRSDDGLIGRSRLSRAPDVLGAALGLQEYSTALWQNGATPSGLVIVPKGMKPESRDRFIAQFRHNYTGASNAKKVIFGEGETKWTSISVSPEDAEVLQSRRFTVAEIARLFQVPPPLLQDYSFSTFTNAAQADLWFARTSLQPWARKIEAEFARSVIADPTGRFHLEIDFSAMTRGDYATRWAANVAAVGAGILTADEVREAEGFAPLPRATAPVAP